VPLDHNATKWGRTCVNRPAPWPNEEDLDGHAAAYAPPRSEDGMTYTPASWTCDACGAPVSIDKMITLQVATGAAIADEYRGGWLGHFHLDCWLDGPCSTVRQNVELHREVAATLARIPVAAEYEVERARRTHRLPDGRRPGEPDPALAGLLAGLPPGVRNALPRAGVLTIDDLERLTDDELLAIDRVGAKTVAYLRERLTGRDAEPQP
jgi:hypothetical protein